MIRYSRSIAILVTSGILTACATAGKEALIEEVTGFVLRGAGVR